MKRTQTKAAKAQALTEGAALKTGLVVGSHGRHCVVETDEGQRVICHPRGKKSQSVVGDRVRWQAATDEGTIEQVEPRRNLFYRQDEIRTKSFAANLDQVLILIAAEPEFSETQLTRALIAAQAEQITPIIALNKCDLGAAFDAAWQRLAPYLAMGYTVLPLSLKQAQAQWQDQVHASSDTLMSPLAAQGHAQLLQVLRGRTSLVLGPSGSGKSTLINALVPGAQVVTGEISQALNSGKHTTTTTTWYWVDRIASDTLQRTALIDSPGFQEFGLHHIAPAQLAALMLDIKAHAGACRFYNCTHLHEPGCGVLAQVESPEQVGTITARRHRIYQQLFAELGQQRW
jgi:ribosome biogenesis GTPase